MNGIRFVASTSFRTSSDAAVLVRLRTIYFLRRRMWDVISGEVLGMLD